MTASLLAMCLGATTVGAEPEPDRVAITDGFARLTYGELGARVRAGAEALSRNGIGPGHFVGIPADRSIDTVIAMLAVWAAGAAYCPIVSPGALSERALALLTTVLVTPMDRSIDGRTKTLAGQADLDSSPAYLMTTSGSFGGPKETVVTRGGLRAVFTGLRTMLRGQLPDGARWTQLHPLTFGYSVCEVLGSIVFGGELVLVPREDPLTLEHLVDAVAAVDRPHVVCLTPSELALLVERVRGAGRPLPSHLVLSGEAAHKAPLSEVFTVDGDGPLVVNTYAATETSGQVTAHVVTPATVDAAVEGYVGEPLPGVEVVLRRREGGGPIPRSDTTSIGEIHVGGPTVAAGYLDFELTARAFGVAGEGRYATGDLGQWSELGGLRVVGRADRTVKLGGQWVGMDAVERLVAESGCVDEVVVFPGTLGAGGPDCLCLAVVPKAAWRGHPVRLREQVVRRVPVRSTVRLSIVDRLPRLTNGKIDTNRLAARSTSDDMRSRPPRDPAEVVRAQWAAVLGAGVATDVNLFELGVDSLGLATVAQRLTTALGVAVPVEFLLDHPRIDLQIARLTGTGANHARPEGVACAGPGRAQRRRQVRAELRAGDGH